MTPREKYLLDNFKLTVEKWQKIFDYQAGLCAICKCVLKKANTDHNHVDGETRGLLCPRCNRALGRFSDSIVLIRAALAYLLDPPARAALGYTHLGYPGRVGTKKHRKMLKKVKKLVQQTKPFMETANVNPTKPSPDSEAPGDPGRG
jgi:recombination endonuclease VII